VFFSEPTSDTCRALKKEIERSVRVITDKKRIIFGIVFSLDD
jgi:hypothetical protein